MHLIDADAFYKAQKERCGDNVPFVGTCSADNAMLYLELKNAPVVDAVPVVRCEKCKHSRKMSYGLGVALMCDVSNRNDKYCNDRQYNSFVVDKDHFCGYGERKDGD